MCAVSYTEVSRFSMQTKMSPVAVSLSTDIRPLGLYAGAPTRMSSPQSRSGHRRVGSSNSLGVLAPPFSWSARYGSGFLTAPSVPPVCPWSTGTRPSQRCCHGGICGSSGPVSISLAARTAAARSRVRRKVFRISSPLSSACLSPACVRREPRWFIYNIPVVLRLSTDRVRVAGKG